MAACVLAVSCGHPVICRSVHYYTEQGLCVHDPVGVGQEAVEEITLIVEREVMRDHGYSLSEIRAEYHDTDVTLHASPRSSDGRLGYVRMTYGPAIDDYFRVHAWSLYDCKNYWILGHELLHVANLTVEGPIKAEASSAKMHPRGWFRHRDYSGAENARSTEHRIEMRIRDRFCE